MGRAVEGGAVGIREIHNPGQTCADIVQKWVHKDFSHSQTPLPKQC